MWQRRSLGRLVHDRCHGNLNFFGDGCDALHVEHSSGEGVKTYPPVISYFSDLLGHGDVKGVVEIDTEQCLPFPSRWSIGLHFER
jgi:hypothetical protein